MPLGVKGMPRGQPALVSAAQIGVIFWPYEIDLQQTNTWTINLKDLFVPFDLGVYCSTSGGVIATQPTIEWGIPTSLAKYKAATLTSKLTGSNTAELFMTLASASNGESALAVTVTVAGSSSGPYKGRPFFRGLTIK